LAVALLIAVVAFIDSPWLQEQANTYYQRTLKLASSEQLLRCRPDQSCPSCAIAELTIRSEWFGETTMIFTSADLIGYATGPQQLWVTRTSPTSYHAENYRVGPGHLSVTLDRVDGTATLQRLGSVSELKTVCDLNPTDRCKYELIFAQIEGKPETAVVKIEERVYRCTPARPRF
jgi:hypothetical protein